MRENGRLAIVAGLWRRLISCDYSTWQHFGLAKKLISLIYQYFQAQLD